MIEWNISFRVAPEPALLWGLIRAESEAEARKIFAKHYPAGVIESARHCGLVPRFPAGSPVYSMPWRNIYGAAGIRKDSVRIG